MHKPAVLQMWDHVRQVNGVGLRLIAMIPESQLDATPIPGMRTPKELAVHMYGQVLRETAEGMLAGKVTDECEQHEKEIAAGLTTSADLLRYCNECWTAADKAVHALTEERLAGDTPTPWGFSFPGFYGMTIILTEYLHHRGQLYAYMRALGLEPPSLWSFHENAEAFRPAATAGA